MRIDILTLFPSMFSPINESMIKRARDRGLLNVYINDLRDFAEGKHRQADDIPYGGGPGMVMMVEPVEKAVRSKRKTDSRVILMCPTGELLTQEKAKALSRHKHFIIICGHYEGIDERIKKFVDEEISIGDYVLTGGELPAMVLVDAVARLIPGVVKEEESLKQESFYGGLLDFPSYTRPSEFEEAIVPEVLRSGNHNEVRRWRRKQSLARTLLKRPDLLPSADLGKEDRELLKEIISGE